ncbi:MAG TPA: OsmC family peroxiredoxin [Acidimicrobiia bacterium]|nr:OsmC family peroxiredoxin [Acidimicrobiia bacterium]
MALDSTARAHWEGDLFTGSGTATLDTGAAGPFEVNWNARAEEHAGVTSPEELIAAAHATCYSMALSNILAKAGHPPASLDVEATATFVAGSGITGMVLRLTADVPGISEEDFQNSAEQAKEGCPVSQALKGNVPITLEATLS